IACLLVLPQKTCDAPPVECSVAWKVKHFKKWAVCSSAKDVEWRIFVVVDISTRVEAGGGVMLSYRFLFQDARIGGWTLLKKSANSNVTSIMVGRWSANVGEWIYVPFEE